jgi:hypothetical protein
VHWIYAEWIATLAHAVAGVVGLKGLTSLGVDADWAAKLALEGEAVGIY